MDLKIDRHSFQNIQIPVLWGNRAIIQEPNLVFSVINIGGITPTLEIVRNQPVPGIDVLPKRWGFEIIWLPEDRYEFNVGEGAFTTNTLGLPDVQIDEFHVRVGTEVYPHLRGFGEVVGLQVMPDEVRFGVPIPLALSRLIVGRSMVA